MQCAPRFLRDDMSKRMKSRLIRTSGRARSRGYVGPMRAPSELDPLDVSFDDVLAARARVAAHIHDTPVLTSTSIDELVGARVHFKAEHLQRVGAFKFRGATNAVLSLDDDQASRGVVAHSSGNHAAALALAAQLRGIPCHIVMPTTVAAPKLAAVQAYGAHIVLCEPTMAARAAGVVDLVATTGAVEIHPYDNPAVIAGQGTAALDLLRAVPAIGALVAPVSGGGLLSGTALAAHGIDPAIAVWGAEPLGADDAARSFAAGTLVTLDAPNTIADGLHAPLSERTFAIIRAHVEGIVTVTEAQIVDAMAVLFERLKQVVEPSAAVALAALLVLHERGTTLPADVGVILSGGNVDVTRLPFAARTDR